TRELQGHEFFAKTRNGKQSPIRIDAIALSKSPVSLMLGDEVPHIFTRKPRLRPLEFLILGAKRLLQHNLPIADIAREALLRRQLIEQRFGLLQIARIEPFSEPAVDRSKQFARLLHLALVAPEACEAHRSAQFP